MVNLDVWGFPPKEKSFKLSFEIRQSGEISQTRMAGSKFLTDGAMELTERSPTDHLFAALTYQ